MIGANFDPSHLFWNGVDPVAAIRKLGAAAGGSAIFHVHGKDVYVDPYNVAVNGCNDNKPYTQIPDRSWTFRSIGYGHDAQGVEGHGRARCGWSATTTSSRSSTRTG